MKISADTFRTARAVRAAQRFKAALKDVRNPGLTLQEVAQKHDASLATVWRWSRQAGVNRGRGRKPLREPSGWQRDYAAGMPLAGIAKKHAVAGATVAVWCRRAGLKAPRRGRRALTQPTQRHRQILKLIRRHTYQEVGRKLGISKQAVGYVAKRWAGWSR